MDTLFIVLAVIFGFVGLLGAVIPVLPGTILSFIGMLCAYAVDGSAITTTQLIIWGALSGIAIVLDYLLPGYFSKMFGGSKKGVMGANIGVFLGIFFGPFGIISGPFIGAFVGELLNDANSTERALKVACGSLLSFFTGTGLKLIVGGFIFYYIAKDVISIVGNTL